MSLSLIITCYFLCLVVADIISTALNGPKLTKIRQPTDGKMYYLIAGNLNQPKTAFEHLLDAIPASSGITFVSYRCFGYSANSFAEAIRKDAHNYASFDVVAISQGAQPALMLAHIANHLYLINPCVNLNFVVKGMRPPLRYVGNILLYIVSYLLGFLGLVPFLGIFGGPNLHSYSLQTLANQYRAICRFNPLKRDNPVNTSVILGELDKFIDNNLAAEYFNGCKEIVTVPAEHGDTVKYADIYRTTLAELIKNANSTNDPA